MIVVLSGLAAGAAHVVTGPDHLAAIAPLAVHEPARGMRVGAMWGLGHGVGVVLAAGIAQLLRELIALDTLAAWSERLVGVVLIVLGLWAFRKASRLVVHSHDHVHPTAAHPGRAILLRPSAGHHHPHGHVTAHHHLSANATAHQHLHVHATARDHDAPRAHARHSHASFWIGTLHGSAGAGHLLGVVPSLALPPLQAALYLGAYLCAAVASMAAVGFLLGRLSHVAGERRLRAVLMSTSVIAIAIGIWWLVASTTATIV